MSPRDACTSLSSSAWVVVPRMEALVQRERYPVLGRVYAHICRRCATGTVGDEKHLLFAVHLHDECASQWPMGRRVSVSIKKYYVVSLCFHACSKAADIRYSCCKVCHLNWLANSIYIISIGCHCSDGLCRVIGLCSSSKQHPPS